MKRVGVLILIAGVALASCKAIKKLGQFYISYNTQAVFPANIPVGVPLSITSPPVTTNSIQQFQNNGTNASLVQSVNLNQLSLTITSPQGQTFSFLQSVSVYISTDSLPEVEVAYRQNIPSNIGDTLNLDVTNADLQAYIKASSIKIRIAGTTDQLLTQNINANVYARFFVQANLLALI